VAAVCLPNLEHAQNAVSALAEEGIHQRLECTERVKWKTSRRERGSVLQECQGKGNIRWVPTSISNYIDHPTSEEDFGQPFMTWRPAKPEAETIQGTATYPVAPQSSKKCNICHDSWIITPKPLSRAQILDTDNSPPCAAPLTRHRSSSAALV